MADRPSWRDIDKKRDGSAHRREPGAAGGNTPRLESTSKNYKRELDRLFKQGGIAEKFKDQLPAAEAGTPVDPVGAARQERLRLVRQAASGAPLVKALDELRREHGLPDDLEILLRALEHPKDEVLREALALIEPHVELGDRLPNKKVFVQRLKGLEFSSFDPAVQRKATALAQRLS